MKLQNKIIVITGASQGLGESLAYKVAKEGAQVLLIARSKDLLEKVAMNIKKEGGKADYFVCDIRNLDEVQKTVKIIFRKFQNIDILINNAGIWTDEELEKKRPDLRKLALEVNTLGHIQITKEFLPHFQINNRGYIFNVISSAGIGDSRAGDNSRWQTYGASKWAMTGFTKALKDSLAGTKIKVTGFHPGGFDSNLYENAKRTDAHKQPWMMKVDDVADVIVFALTRPDDVLIERIIVTKIQ